VSGLPELYQGELDDAGATRLFGEMAAARVSEVRVKGGATRFADPMALTLGEAAQQLAAGAVLAVQVRYVWQGREWIDTLTRKPDGGIAVVRMAVPERQDAA
jgi:hypothetical protein